MSNIHVTTKVNGDAVEYVCEADETLLDALRDRLGLTGSKEGCGSGDCGACSVVLDGRLVCSCLVLGAEAEGRDIRTIEGMAKGDKLHPLQRQFIEHAVPDELMMRILHGEQDMRFHRPILAGDDLRCRAKVIGIHGKSSGCAGGSQGAAGEEQEADRARGAVLAGRESLPLHRLRQDRARGHGRRR